MISMAMNDSENLSYFLDWARGDIVEYILSLSLTGARYDEYDLISYNGKKQVYMIKDRV